MDHHSSSAKKDPASSPQTPGPTRISASEETPPKPIAFDFSAYPEDTLFYERRTRNLESGPPVEPTKRPKVERRKRVDPCTFEKQYSPDETEFMNAMQQFKIQSGKAFPTHGDVLRIARELGYRKSGRPTALPGGPPTDPPRS